jgi:hypothetical protein
MIKLIKLPPRTKFYGFDYTKNLQFRMTGKEWHEYARRETFKVEHGGDTAFGNKCEIYLDGKPVAGLPMANEDDL